MLCFSRLPWKDVVSMAADVAKNGFNVTRDLGNCRLLFHQRLSQATIFNYKHSSIFLKPLCCFN